MSRCARRKLSFLILPFAAVASFIPFGLSAAQFPVSASDYQVLEAGKNLSLIDTLKFRINHEPFNLIATVIFLLAVVHTFLASKFAKISKKLLSTSGENSAKSHFLATVFHFLGEVETVFGIWVVPLVVMMGVRFGWRTVSEYFSNVSFAEPIFVMVIMAMAATRPVMYIAEKILSTIARIGKNSVGAWWLTILTVSPLLGSFITEPAAMTIGALLLSKQFYSLMPSERLRYATIGLLFVNVSIGGTMTHFAAPPILMVAHKWGLTFSNVISMLGQHALVAIIANVVIYYLIFFREFRDLQKKREKTSNMSNGNERIPLTIVATHVAFLAWTVMNLHTPALVIAGFLFFLAFLEATKLYQFDINLRSPVLVGFFLAALVVHGGLQEWWIAPVLNSLTRIPLFIGATALTAFNDNAAITYLSSLVPEFAKNVGLQKAVLAGAVTGGGLTVIANAPNPAGQNVLSKYFCGGISPLRLLLAALIPTVVTALCFNLW